LKARFTPGARRELLAALAYLQRENPPAAVAFRRKVERAVRRLERFPASGRPIPEFPDLPHREVVLPPYRLFYRVERRTLWVVAVWHGARIPMRPGVRTEDDPPYPPGVHEPGSTRRSR
jgi:plasmid stabilization system protein ParE